MKFSRVVAQVYRGPQAFRQRLQKDIILAVIAILILVVGFAAWQFYQARRNISSARTLQILDQTERTFQILAREVTQRILSTVKAEGENGELLLTDIDALKARFVPILRKIPFRVLLSITAENGQQYLVYEDTLSWQSHIIPATEVTDLEVSGEDLLFVDEQIEWLFSSITLPGLEMESLTARIRWNWQAQTYVAAIHADRQQIFRLVAMLSGTPQGYILFFTEDFTDFTTEQSIINTPSDRPYLESKPDMPANTDRDQQVKQNIAGIIRQWQTQDSERLDPVRFRIGEAFWWTAIRSVNSDDRMAYWLGIAIPEEEALPEIERGQKIFLTTMLSSLGGLVLLIAIQAHVLLRFYRELRQHEEALPKPNQEGILTLIRHGESTTLEFKSTLRWNLKTSKPGKEIEIAWLKTVVAYLNTNGGTILIGVKDSGEIVGLEADNFQNDDRLLLHVNNLIKQHIGAEFSRFINAQLVSVRGRNVLMIDCQTSPQPVFLKHQNEEHFYIRTGPSSTKLSTSEVLKYVEQRQVPQKP